MNFIESHDESIELHVLVQPRSSMNKIIGVMNNRLKIKLKAPPVDGAANKMCIQFLAKTLHVPKSHIEILSGKSSRQKNIRIMGDPAAMMRQMMQLTK
jgi:hypothetical protein